MTRYIAFSALLLAGCPKQAPSAAPGSIASDLEGSWLDEGGTRLRFTRTGQGLHVSSIVDSDGESFSLLGEEIRGGAFWFSYHVPSTGYNVEINVLSVEGDVAHTTWSNDHDASGTEDMVRQR